MTLTLTWDRVKITLVPISGRRLPTHQIRLKSEKLFVDVQMDGRTDTPEFQSIRSLSPGDDLKNWGLCPFLYFKRHAMTDFEGQSRSSDMIGDVSFPMTGL